jgi:hypothetical protein
MNITAIADERGPWMRRLVPGFGPVIPDSLLMFAFTFILYSWDFREIRICFAGLHLPLP